MRIFVVFNDNEEFVAVTKSERHAIKLEEDYGGFYEVFEEDPELKDFYYVSSSDEDNEEED